VMRWCLHSEAVKVICYFVFFLKKNKTKTGKRIL
jgi:hypothetical protein